VVLYVGKAKNLRSRVRSYFGSGAAGDPRLARWVARIAAHFQGYLAVDGVYDPVHWREWGVRLVTADMVTEFIHNATGSLSQFEQVGSLPLSCWHP